jgi:hypothetical protein
VFFSCRYRSTHPAGLSGCNRAFRRSACCDRDPVRGRASTWPARSSQEPMSIRRSESIFCSRDMSTQQRTHQFGERLRPGGDCLAVPLGPWVVTPAEHPESSARNRKSGAPAIAGISFIINRMKYQAVVRLHARRGGQFPPFPSV